MNTRKMLPTLLFAAILSLTLFGCDSGSNSSSAANNAANQPTNASVSNHPVANPPSGASNATSSAGSGGATKLTLVKYVPLQLSSGGQTYYDYIGIIKNDGNSSVAQPRIQLMNDSGTVLGTGVTEGLLAEVYALPPGQSVGFNMLYMMGASIKQPQFKLSVEGDSALVKMCTKLPVLSQQASTSGVGQLLTGTVKNDTAHSLIMWSVNVIAYDDSGNIVDTGSGNGASAGNANDSGIPFDAQSTQKFSVTLTSSAAKATHYDLLASGCWLH